MNTNETFKIAAKVTFDEAVLMQRINKGAALAQIKLDAQVLADSNYYCPLKTGALQKSGIIATVIGNALVVWKTPYARMQYYGVNFDRSQDPNPNACSKWFEAAKVRKKEQWRKLVNDTIKNS